MYTHAADSQGKENNLRTANPTLWKLSYNSSIIIFGPHLY
jgi:hypothetical protein